MAHSRVQGGQARKELEGLVGDAGPEAGQVLGFAGRRGCPALSEEVTFWLGVEGGVSGSWMAGGKVSVAFEQSTGALVRGHMCLLRRFRGAVEGF